MIPLALLAVAWTAVSIVVGDAMGGDAYPIISGAVFVIVLGHRRVWRCAA